MGNRRFRKAKSRRSSRELVSRKLKIDQRSRGFIGWVRRCVEVGSERIRYCLWGAGDSLYFWCICVEMQRCRCVVEFVLPIEIDAVSDEDTDGAEDAGDNVVPDGDSDGKRGVVGDLMPRPGYHSG